MLLFIFIIYEFQGNYNGCRYSLLSNNPDLDFQNLDLINLNLDLSSPRSSEKLSYLTGSIRFALLVASECKIWDVISPADWHIS